MQAQNSICFDSIPDTHYFSYKNKLFPIKYDFFKYSSEYFQNNEEEIKAQKTLQLLEQNDDGDINLSEDSIQSFIDFVQSKSITLNDENVSELNFLSKKYIVNTLTKFTEDYIESHHENLILPILICRQYDSEFQTETYEDILIQHFLDYIKDDRLFNLNFNILHRIISKYLHKEYDTESGLFNVSAELIEFLFTCLDKYGKKASVLFSNIDIYTSNSKYLARLLKDYSDTFDFHFINPSFVNELYEKENIHIQQVCLHNLTEEKNEKEIKNLNETMQKVKDGIQQLFISFSNELNKQWSQRFKSALKEIQGIKSEMEQMKSSYSKELNVQKEALKMTGNKQEKDSLNFSNEIQTIKKEIEQMKSSYSKVLIEQNEALKMTGNKQEKDSLNFSNEIQTIKKEIEQMKSSYSKELNEQKEALNKTQSQQNESTQNIQKEISEIKSSYTKELDEQKQELTQKENSQVEKYQNLEKDVQELKKKIESSQPHKVVNKHGNKKLVTQSPPEKVTNNSSQEGSQTSQSPTQKVSSSSSQGGMQMSRSQQLAPKWMKSSNVSQSPSNQSSRPKPSIVERTKTSPIGSFMKKDDSDDDILHHLSLANQLSSSLSMKSQMPPSISLICTYAASGKGRMTQKWYECRTCHLEEGLGICEVCARCCHKGHDVVYTGIGYDCFCDCPVKSNCKCCSQMKQSCTSERFMGPITQPMYRCSSCDEDKLICQYCAIKHHHGHNLYYLGVVENKICRNDEIGRFSRSVILPRRFPFGLDSDSDS